MKINADFSQQVVVEADEVPWVPSPIPGVERRMLDRVGDEVARATSLVRYAPGSRFSPHVHTGGEEFFVLQGVFQDEHGDFPAGSYIRNPPTSSHTPGSDEGCIIFVKLWQFDLADRTPVKIDTNKIGSVRDADRPGVSVTPLFQDARETVQLEQWAPGTSVDRPMPEGAELLVLDGDMALSGDVLRKHAWLRIPLHGHLQACAGSGGTRVWIKTRHLRFVDAPALDSRP